MISKIKIIIKSYSQASFSTKLFIIVRSIVCPWNIILDHLPDKGSVLDIGCGHGLFLHLAKDKYPDLKCVGYDHDKHKIDIASNSSKRKEIAFFLDSQIDGLEPESFDCITVIDVLYSVPLEKWPDIFAVARKYLKPDGKIIIKETVSSPRWKYYICLLQEFVAIKILKYTKGKSPILESVRFYLQQIETNDLATQGHKRVDQGYLWPHYLFVCNKITTS
jgi:cyclopropane fatty-acyl-phospholipid synthase-like methyltransferase